MWVGEQRKKCRNAEMIFGMGNGTDWSPLCVACRGRLWPSALLTGDKLKRLEWTWVHELTSWAVGRGGHCRRNGDTSLPSCVFSGLFLFDRPAVSNRNEPCCMFPRCVPSWVLIAFHGPSHSREPSRRAIKDIHKMAGGFR
jgi:hypothetical protein